MLLRGPKIIFVGGSVLDLGKFITENGRYRVEQDNFYKYLKGVDEKRD